MTTVPDTFDAFTIHLPDEAATERLATDLIAVLRTGDVVALSGDLGAGKSTLARFIIRHLAQDPHLEVPSPTYTLVQTYETLPKVSHFDLYRLGEDSELEELGFDEAAETGIVLVEWPERAEQARTDANLTIELSIAKSGGRDAVLRPAPEIALRLAHSLRIRNLLNEAGLEGAKRMPFPADASSRRYERVECGEASLILMDSPALPRGPVVSAGRTYAQIAHIAQDVRPFIAMAEELERLGFTAPTVETANVDAGLVLLRDLGQDVIVSNDGTPIAERFCASARALAALHQAFTAPAITSKYGFAWEIPEFDRPALAIEVELLPEWYWPRQNGTEMDERQRARYHTAWTPLLQRLEEARRGIILRDFHSPNILWQADSSGHRKVGLLDFQDAMYGPVAYDLASLAQDARVDISPELEDQIFQAYVQEAIGLDPDFDEMSFAADYAIVAAQRASKLLGLFVRLHERDGKPQYLRHIPRIQSYLARSVAHPVNIALKDLYAEWGLVAARN
ncbi:tRNA (adenosine(37)-N6)-threonylcarbamoyltransferase complex ATPase subunit type 1 TsaE [Aureimonas fodinaquatilis]|uniref:tRNA threonylcarbamoyladenosine biosynthesis protein TsaE n=2 Tax=Aureimonas fodinaquatilis TaxID=2565783 RepID=A0A5B0DRM3_9HYPH|nr:tRNA (adenosine(37)-N6)-threonylcarbamoyltransferase complex ATPase subunit type 1 TsaE [Aureimonas fodinaquatilis]